MVNALSNLDFIVSNLKIEKQYEEIKKSGKGKYFHFAVKNKRFVILEKSSWLIGRIWFQFQVLLGWISTSQASINSVRKEINRLRDTHEIQQIISSLLNDNTPANSNRTGIAEVLSAIIDKMNKKIIKSKKDLRDIETLKETLENEEIMPNITEKMRQCRFNYISIKNKEYKREIEILSTLNKSLTEQILAKERVIIEQGSRIIEQRNKILEDEEIIEELSQMIDGEKLVKEFMSPAKSKPGHELLTKEIVNKEVAQERNVEENITKT